MEFKFIPLDYDYIDDEEGKPVIRIFGKTDKHEQICVLDTCKPYFYIVPTKRTNIDKFIKIIENTAFENAGRKCYVEKVAKVKKKDLGKEVTALKIIVSNPKDAHAIKSYIKDHNNYECSREVDLNFITRYITEKKIKPLFWYKVEGDIKEKQPFKIIKAKKITEIKELPFTPKALAFDIETEDPEPEKGKVLMLSLVGKNFQKVITWKKFKNAPKEIEFVDNEKALLLKFREYVKQQNPDILTGYFSDGFDLPFLRERFRLNKIPFDLSWDSSSMNLIRGALSSAKFTGLVHLDIFKFVSGAIVASLNTETLSLNDVSEELLGETKVKIDFNPWTLAQELDAMNSKELKRFCFYNLQDSVLAYKLFEKLWPMMIELTKLIQEPLFTVTRNGYTHLLENFIIHHLDQFNEFIRNRPTRDEISERRAREKSPGAFVLEPRYGLYENMVVFDFTGMYTTLLITFNVDPSTIQEVKKSQKYDIEVDLEGKKRYFFFDKKKKAIFPELINYTFLKREKIKEKLNKKYDPVLSA
ncbi:MAG: ribonuclease H-like domain-containing protein, partial [archaeon]